MDLREELKCVFSMQVKTGSSATPFGLTVIPTTARQSLCKFSPILVHTKFYWMDQRTFKFDTRGHHITLTNKNMSLCSKHSSLLSSYAVHSSGKLKGALWSIGTLLLLIPSFNELVWFGRGIVGLKVCFLPSINCFSEKLDEKGT